MYVNQNESRLTLWHIYVQNTLDKYIFESVNKNIEIVGLLEYPAQRMGATAGDEW